MEEKESGAGDVSLGEKFPRAGEEHGRLGRGDAFSRGGRLGGRIEKRARPREAEPRSIDARARGLDAEDEGSARLRRIARIEQVDVDRIVAACGLAQGEGEILHILVLYHPRAASRALPGRKRGLRRKATQEHITRMALAKQRRKRELAAL